MRRLLWCLIFFQLVGCGYSVPVVLDQTRAARDSVQVDKMNRQLTDRIVTIYRNDGSEMDAIYVRCTSDSLVYVAEGDSLRAAVSVRFVKSVERRDHVAGLVGGAFLGSFGLGTLAGFTTYYAFNETGEGRGFGAMVAAVLGFVLGGTGGAVYGGIHGVSVEYRLPADTTAVGR
jgi:hypothetical protein